MADGKMSLLNSRKGYIIMLTVSSSLQCRPCTIARITDFIEEEESAWVDVRDKNNVACSHY